MSVRFILAREGCDLAGERWPGNPPLVVLLHEGSPNGAAGTR